MGSEMCIRDRVFTMTTISNNLQKNCFPLNVSESGIKSYINGKYSETNKDAEQTCDELRYYKLPFIGKFSSLTQKKINKIIGKFCKENIKPVTSAKLIAIFPLGLKNIFKGQIFTHIQTPSRIIGMQTFE